VRFIAWAKIGSEISVEKTAILNPAEINFVILFFKKVLLNMLSFDVRAGKYVYHWGAYARKSTDTTVSAIFRPITATS
jgi:hypothetical protein